jgi:eukaryotic-like serine/threonine-protein kinase
MSVSTQSAPPRILAGKYRVICALGEGGMGEVLLATHIQLEQKVAIKILKRELASDPVEVERFLREARAAARINNDHVVRVSDVASLENGQPYIVMEYLEGEDLARRLESGALPIDEAIECMLQACLAIAEAHRVGIVHRDLKPANLFLVRRRDGSNILKVVDFGISKLAPTTGRPEASLTANGILGSPFYMSPEQITMSASLDRRTDLWSLGLILFELVTGEGPFEAATMAQLCQKIVKAPARRMRDVRPDLSIPAGLEEVVARCLAKNPDERYEDTVDLAQALVPFAGASSLTARRIADSSPTKPPPPDVEARSIVVMTPAVPLVPSVDPFPVPVPAPVARTAHRGQDATKISWDPGSESAKRRRRGLAIAAGTMVIVACAAVGIVKATSSPARTAPVTTTELRSESPVVPEVKSVIPPAPSASAAPIEAAPPPGPGTARIAPVTAAPIARGPRVVPSTAPGKSAKSTAPPGDEFGGRK